MSIKKSNDTIGNRTRDHPVCSAVSQLSAPPRAVKYEMCFLLTFVNLTENCTQKLFLQPIQQFDIQAHRVHEIKIDPT
jgi:hypothetical protein